MLVTNKMKVKIEYDKYNRARLVEFEGTQKEYFEILSHTIKEIRGEKKW